VHYLYTEYKQLPVNLLWAYSNKNMPALLTTPEKAHIFQLIKAQLTTVSVKVGNVTPRKH
jgi:hypothetical protein